MIRRLILVIFVLMFLGLVWIGSLAAVTVAIVKKRKPDICMNYYYEKLNPTDFSLTCEGSYD